MKYADKLKDPRWQKKRLEILNRDEWKCRFCWDDKSTLHVHHLSYSTNPWDTKNEHLLTLCETCHESESLSRPEIEKELIQTLREKGYSYYTLISISEAFQLLKDFHVHDVMGSVISWVFSNDELMKSLCDQYFAELEKKRIERGGSIEDFDF